MAEYIERDKAIAVIEERARLRNHAHDMISYQYLKLAKWDIDDIPAADVRPVVRGRLTVMQKMVTVVHAESLSEDGQKKSSCNAIFGERQRRASDEVQRMPTFQNRISAHDAVGYGACCL